MSPERERASLLLWKPTIRRAPWTGSLWMCVAWVIDDSTALGVREVVAYGSSPERSFERFHEKLGWIAEGSRERAERRPEPGTA